MSDGAGLRAAILAIPTPELYENDANGNWFTTDMEYGWDCAIEAAAALASSPAPAGLDAAYAEVAAREAADAAFPDSAVAREHFLQGFRAATRPAEDAGE